MHAESSKISYRGVFPLDDITVCVAALCEDQGLWNNCTSMTFNVVQ